MCQEVSFRGQNIDAFRTQEELRTWQMPLHNPAAFFRAKAETYLVMVNLARDENHRSILQMLSEENEAKAKLFELIQSRETVLANKLANCGAAIRARSYH
jgi:hypothetical protein